MLEWVQNLSLQWIQHCFFNSNGAIFLITGRDRIIIINSFHLELRSVNCLSIGRPLTFDGNTFTSKPTIFIQVINKKYFQLFLDRTRTLVLHARLFRARSDPQVNLCTQKVCPGVVCFQFIFFLRCQFSISTQHM